MMTILMIIIFVGVGLGVYIWSLYNQLVTLKTRIKASVQEIGNQLKRQADLIPNLAQALKGYLAHEKAIFEKIAQARESVLRVVGSGDAQKLIDASNQLQTAVAPIRALVESNPQLQGVGPTNKLMDELRDTADKVMYSRRTLIDLTADYNLKLVTFPANVFAGLFGFKAEVGLKTPAEGTHLEVSDRDIKTPIIS